MRWIDKRSTKRTKLESLKNNAFCTLWFRLQERLMILQQAQLENMAKWLTKMETTMFKAEPIATDAEIVKRQIELHLVNFIF